MRPALLLAALWAAVSGAGAQTPSSDVAKPMTMPQPSCTAPAPLPAAYASFAHPLAAAQGSGVFIGKAFTLALGPGMHFFLPPGHTPAGGSFGGMIGFNVTLPGTYRVATGSAVWIGVVRNSGPNAGTTTVASVAHAHGPACTAVRKLVDFTLRPGHYMLQFSGSTTPSVTFQIAKAS